MSPEVSPSRVSGDTGRGVGRGRLRAATEVTVTPAFQPVSPQPPPSQAPTSQPGESSTKSRKSQAVKIIEQK